MLPHVRPSSPSPPVLREVNQPCHHEKCETSGWATWRFIRITLLWLVLGVGAYAAVKYGGVRVSGTSTSTLTTLPLLIMAGLILLAFILFIVRVSIGNIYALIIETAGTPRAALISRDFPKMNELVRLIMHAINNPGMPPVTMHLTTVNSGNFFGPNYGEMNNAIGAGSTGKAVR